MLTYAGRISCAIAPPIWRTRDDPGNGSARGRRDGRAGGRHAPPDRRIGRPGQGDPASAARLLGPLVGRDSRALSGAAERGGRLARLPRGPRERASPVRSAGAGLALPVEPARTSLPERLPRADLGDHRGARPAPE